MKIHAIEILSKKRVASEVELDVIVEQLDNMLGDGDFPSTDIVLLELLTRQIDIESMLAVLAVTRPAKEQLKNRAEFLAYVESRLEVEAPDRSESLLSGLR